MRTLCYPSINGKFSARLSVGSNFSGLAESNERIGIEHYRLQGDAVALRLWRWKSAWGAPRWDPTKNAKAAPKGRFLIKYISQWLRLVAGRGFEPLTFRL